MPKYAISAENVTVEYFIPEYHYSGIKEFIIKQLKRKNQGRYLKALNNVSLRIDKGESVALLGHNGSGKSTFLKVLAGIIEPKNAVIDVKGRVAPMIELGTGFDGELSGYENIFLSCTLLGLSQDEITKRIGEIISFAELERFIHMPVKNYSSGMQARLGFACATAINPQVLLVDEVLSVGDSNFAKKCLQRIDELKQQGTTVVLVSHDANTVRTFCTRGFVFFEGELKFAGHILDALEVHDNLMTERYLGHLSSGAQAEEKRRLQLKKNDEFNNAPLPKVSVNFNILQNGKSIKNQILDLAAEFTLEILAHVRDTENIRKDIALGFAFQTAQGQRIFGSNNVKHGIIFNLPEDSKGEQRFTCKFKFKDDFRKLTLDKMELVLGVHDSNLTRTCYIANVAEIVCTNSLYTDTNYDGDLIHTQCEII